MPRRNPQSRAVSPAHPLLRSPRPAELATSPRPTTLGQSKSAVLPPLKAKAIVVPVWLQHLDRWKQLSTVTAIGSSLALLSLYGWTVYTQQQWSKSYTLLEELKRHERQYVLNQESMSNALRDTAAQSGMQPLVPQRMIRIPVSPAPLAQPTPAAPDPIDTTVFFPVGY